VDGGGRTPAELATRLAEAIGRPEEMVAVLAGDVTWWESPSVPVEIMATFSVGRDTVLATMRRVFSVIYRGETFRTTVHQAVGAGSTGVVRFALTGEFPNGAPYRNEYSIWVDTRDGEITEVWEYVDAACTLAQLRAAGIEPAPAGLQELPNAASGRC
jgi:ketosteroid isomerase-like protein